MATTPTPDPNINYAFNMPVNVSSFKDSSQAGEFAVDGNIATMWKTRKASGKNKLPSEWIVVDLAAEQNVARVVLQWDSYYATNYTIAVSSDANQWTNVSTTTSGDGGVDEIDFNPLNARYIKMDSTSWNNGSWRISLSEFEVYAAGGAAPTPTPTPTPTPGPTIGVHIGDLTSSANLGNRNRWQASVNVVVHDDAENPLAGVLVTGTWSNGVSNSGSCTTNSFGVCTIKLNNIKGNVGSVDFSIGDLSLSSYGYLPADNHDASGTPLDPVLTILKP